MAQGFISKADIVIDAHVSTVWDALINPDIVKQYFFGTEVVSDWEVGSSIVYKGEWEGKKYEDKGVILEFEPEQRLVSTYWSSIGGREDVPENYNTVTYEVAEVGEGMTKLTITQDNSPTEESAQHSQDNWEQILQGMKELLEK